MIKASNDNKQAKRKSLISVPMVALTILAAAGLATGGWLALQSPEQDPLATQTIVMEVGDQRTLETALSNAFTVTASLDGAATIAEDTYLITANAVGQSTILAKDSVTGEEQLFYVNVVADRNTAAGTNANSDDTTTTSTTSSAATTTTTTESTTEGTTTTVSLPPGSVTGIELTFYNVNLAIGQSKMPIVTMLPSDATDKSEKWTTTDEAVATVDELGNITAVGAGTCTVRVTSVNNPAVYAEVTVTVKDPNGSSTGQANITTSNGVTFVDGILIANKTYGLPASYAPGVNADAKAAFERMQTAAAMEMMTLTIVSSYRSYETQQILYERYCNRDGQAAADRYSARPGHSEHQTGLAFDINNASSSFDDTPEAQWLAENCWRYGFIIRYPEGKEDVTGYQYESWHIRYLGEEKARAVYESGLTLEEYLGITSEYAS